MRIRINRWIREFKQRWWLDKASKLATPLSDVRIKPFFIISSGRSGTTLLRKKLMNHELIHIPSESDDLIPRNALNFVKHNHKGWDKLVKFIIDDFRSAACIQFWHTDFLGLEDILIQTPMRERSYAALVNQVYRCHAKPHKPSMEIWGDKTPYLVYYLPWLRAIFPKAKYIHLVRDGRAAVHSMINKRDYKLEKAAARWRDSIRLFDEHCRQIKETQWIEIQYESLVRNPKQILAQVCAFIGVPFDENLLDDRDHILGDDVLAHHDNLEKPITTKLIDRWKEDMNEEEIRFLNASLEKELRSRKYEL